MTAENPDIRLFRKEDDLVGIKKAQRAILAACAGYVKKGGFLYYSTCSVFGEENDGAVEHFLKENDAFEVCTAQSPLSFVRKKYGIQFLPHLTGGAGFYFAKLKRVR